MIIHGSIYIIAIAPKTTAAAPNTLADMADAAPVIWMVVPLVVAVAAPVAATTVETVDEVV